VEGVSHHEAEQMNMRSCRAGEWPRGIVQLTVITLLAFSLLLDPSRASAVTGFYTGKKLLELCERVWTEQLCVVYIAGVSDAHAVDSARQTFPEAACVPEHVMGSQLEGIVVKWLKEHPEMLHDDAAPLVLMALHDAFPCGEKK